MTMMTPDEKKVEAHLDALEQIGPVLAAAKAEADFLTDMLKTVQAAEYLRSAGPRVGDREAESYASENYMKALTRRRDATMAYEKLRHEKAFRERAIEVWQTMSANRRGRI